MLQEVEPTVERLVEPTVEPTVTVTVRVRVRVEGTLFEVDTLASSHVNRARLALLLLQLASTMRSQATLFPLPSLFFFPLLWSNAGEKICQPKRHNTFEVTTQKMEEQPEKTVPQKLSDAFEQRLKKYHAVFQEAYDHVMSEVKEEIKHSENFVKFVIRAMVAVKDADLHGLEKKEIVVDIVHKVVDAMPIPDDEKATLKARTFPTIENIIDAMVYASKGYMYLKHKSAEAAEDVREGCTACQQRCLLRCRGCRRQHPEQAARSARAEPIDDEHLDLNALVDEVYDVVKTVVRVKQVTLANIVSIGSTIMQVVEEYPGLVGYQKKHLVLRVAHRLVDDLVQTDDATREMIKVAIDTTLDKAIDFIIKASRGEIELINKIADAVERGCAKCC